MGQCSSNETFRKGIIYRKWINLRRFNEVESFNVAVENRRVLSQTQSRRVLLVWCEARPNEHTLRAPGAQKYLQEDPGLVTRDYFDGSRSLFPRFLQVVEWSQLGNCFPVTNRQIVSQEKGHINWNVSRDLTFGKSINFAKLETW